MDQNAAASKPILNNRYQLQQTLGTGGMAVVYKAKDLMLERLVAVKVLRPSFSRDDAFRERFRLEARAAANLSHPNIVTVHDFGLDTTQLFIVMEYIPGTDLKSLLKRSGIFSIEEAISLVAQACAGIGYAHRAGLVHCDVKPHNMLVTPDQRLKVTDFGISRALASIHPDEQNEIVWGSPLYFSPEQAAGLAPSPASDVYSLGIVLYELLTGQLPFNANDAGELARMHREVPPTPPRQINPDIPYALEQIVLKVLSKEPAARYRTADQLGRVLLTFGQQRAQTTYIPPAAVRTVATPPVAVQRPMPPQPPIQPNYAPQQPVVMPPVYQAPQVAQIPAQAYAAPQPAESEAEEGLGIDWATLLIGFLAFISVGGLFPFWIYVILNLRATP
jgi:serine/threonine-protein kinase